MIGISLRFRDLNSYKYICGGVSPGDAKKKFVWSRIPSLSEMERMAATMSGLCVAIMILRPMVLCNKTNSLAYSTIH